MAGGDGFCGAGRHPGAATGEGFDGWVGAKFDLEVRPLVEADRCEVSECPVFFPSEKDEVGIAWDDFAPGNSGRFGFDEGDVELLEEEEEFIGLEGFPAGAEFSEAERIDRFFDVAREVPLPKGEGAEEVGVIFRGDVGNCPFDREASSCAAEPGRG